jgi:hypothetical protein
MTKSNLLVAVSGRFSSGGADPVEVEFRGSQRISDRAHRLLNRADGLDVEFRKSTVELRGDDLVGFANSRDGGAILIGVHETRDSSGRRRGFLAGSPIGDPERRRILAQAKQCVPPVPVSIFEENRAERPFYRIEVPSGQRKPYCTADGVYKIRNNGRNETLYPAQLLDLLLEANGEEILRRLGQAPRSLVPAVQEVQPHGAMEERHGSQSAWDSLRAPAESAPNGSAEGTAECSVRLCSQDLCGFLMGIA